MEAKDCKKLPGIGNDSEKLMADLEAKRKADEDRKRLCVFFSVVFLILIIMGALGASFK